LEHHLDLATALGDLDLLGLGPKPDHPDLELIRPGRKIVDPVPPEGVGGGPGHHLAAPREKHVGAGERLPVGAVRDGARDVAGREGQREQSSEHVHSARGRMTRSPGGGRSRLMS
jgi:hypothetical protein